MAKLDLPVAPFEIPEEYTRANNIKKAVYGINNQGFGFVHIEEAQPDEIGLTVRWVPEDMPYKFVHGVCQPIEVYWEKELYLNGRFVKKTGERKHLKLNHPDMAEFTANMGIQMMKLMLNGEIRAIEGFDDQPLFNSLGERIPDTNYDTTLPPANSYKTHSIRVIEETGTEEPIV